METSLCKRSINIIANNILLIKPDCFLTWRPSLFFKAHHVGKCENCRKLSAPRVILGMSWGRPERAFELRKRNLSLFFHLNASTSRPFQHKMEKKPKKGKNLMHILFYRLLSMWGKFHSFTKGRENFEMYYPRKQTARLGQELCKIMNVSTKEFIKTCWYCVCVWMSSKQRGGRE